VNPIEQVQEEMEQLAIRRERERKLLIQVAYWVNLHREERLRRRVVKDFDPLMEARNTVADLLSEFPRLFDDTGLT
jgi:flagellar biosynthesis regulator FlaF